MGTMLKATFRCMKHLWEHPIAKSSFNPDFAPKMSKNLIR